MIPDDAICIRVTDKRTIVVRETVYSDLRCIDIRNWIHFRGGERVVPTKKGIFLDYETTRDELIPALIKITGYGNGKQ